MDFWIIDDGNNECHVKLETFYMRLWQDLKGLLDKNCQCCFEIDQITSKKFHFVCEQWNADN